MEKTISVEAAAEGPRVKPKRQLTEAQLAALKKGRERLAAKRQATVKAVTSLPVEELPSEGAIAAAAAASEQPQQQEQFQPQEEQHLERQQQQEADSSSDEEYLYSGPCAVM